MLIIRQEQFDAFRPEADESFARRLAAHVRERHAGVAVRLPGKTTVVKRLSEATLLGLVRGGITRARGYGLVNESSIAAYVAAMFVTAPNFDEHPLVRRVITDGKILPDLKMDRILKSVTAQNLRAIKETYNPNSWREEPRRADR